MSDFYSIGHLFCTFAGEKFKRFYYNKLIENIRNGKIYQHFSQLNVDTLAELQTAALKIRSNIVKYYFFQYRKEHAQIRTMISIYFNVFKCTNFQFAQMNIEIAFGWIKTSTSTTTTLAKVCYDMAQKIFEDEFGKKLFLFIVYFSLSITCTLYVVCAMCDVRSIPLHNVQCQL